MSKVNAEPADEASGLYRELIRQNAAFSRAVYVALQAGTETAAGMTATVADTEGRQPRLKFGLDAFPVRRRVVASAGSATATHLRDRADMAKDTPPTCPRCNQLMRLLRNVPSVGGLPELFVFHCAECNEAQTQEWEHSERERSSRIS